MARFVEGVSQPPGKKKKTKSETRTGAVAHEEKRKRTFHSVNFFSVLAVIGFRITIRTIVNKLCMFAVCIFLHCWYQVFTIGLLADKKYHYFRCLHRGSVWGHKGGSVSEPNLVHLTLN